MKSHNSNPDELPPLEPRPVIVQGLELTAWFPNFRYWQDISGQIPATKKGDPVRRIDCGNEVLDYCGPGPWRLLTDQPKEYPYLAQVAR